MSHWVVAADEAGCRLDKFLAGHGRLGSRGQAASALERGKVFVGDDEMSRTDAGRRVAAGERIRVWMDRPGSSVRKSIRKNRPGEAQILCDDGVIIVVNKPSGLLTVPLERRPEEASVEEQLVDYLRPRGKRRPLVVHRIDRDTSGLVMFATDADAQQQLKNQFRRHEPERVYLAVVYGRPDPPAGTWRDQLAWDQKALIQKETHPHDPRGKEAISEYRTIEAFKDTSLIEVRLITGKRNQIRLQARLRGHTLVGEQRYIYGADGMRPVSFERQALHAFRLGFEHPRSREPMRFEAPVPPDMADLLRQLRPR